MTKKQTSKPRAGRSRGTTTKGTKGTKGTTRRAAKRSKSTKPTTGSKPGRTRDPRIPAPGTIITRHYKGRDLRLTVLEDGFRFEGTVYRSLTAAALQATGYPAISGPHFWRLDGSAQPGGTTAESTAETAESAATETSTD